MLILKYIIPQYDGYIYYGGANVGMNAGIMISYVHSLPLSCILVASFGAALGALENGTIRVWKRSRQS